MKQHKTKLKLTSLVLSLLMLLLPATSVWAQSETAILSSGACGTNANWQVKVTTVLKQKVYSLEITGSGAMKDYSSTANAPWKSYTDNSTGTRVTIDLKTLITKVTISDDITTIGNYAFDGLSKVKSINLPSSLTTIGTRAFASTGIQKVFLPTTLTTIAEDAYNGCSSLSFIQFDGSYTKSLSLTGLPTTGGRLITKDVAPIGGALIRETISTPSGWDRYYHYDQCLGGAWVAYSGSKLYFYAKESGKTVNLSTTESFVATSNYGDTKYYPWMSKHTSITSLEIDKNVSSIADYALDCSMYSSNATEYGFNSLETITVESGNSAYVVGEDGALYSKDKTTLVLYPAKSAATELSIDEATTTIKDYAFSGATNLTSLSFGEKVSSIGKYVINNTTSLKTIAFKSAVVPTFNSTYSFINHATTGTLYVPSKYDYSSLIARFPNWTAEDSAGQVGTIRWSYNDGVLTFTGIDALVKSTDWAQYAATTRSIVIGEGITAITANNFQNFTALESVTVPYTMTEFGTDAFKGSTLKEVNLTLPQTVYSWEVLDKFSQVKNVGALTAGKGALLLSVNGNQLTESSHIALPAFYNNPDKDAIRYFSNIYNLQISGIYPQIPESFFAGWEYLKNVTFGYGTAMWKINANAFANSSLESISLPSTIKEIGADAFYNCRNLKNVELHDGVVIRNAAFMYSIIENLKITFHDGIISADERLRFAYIEDGSYQPFYAASIKHIDICHNVSDTQFKDGYALQRWCETSHIEYFKSARPEAGITLSLNGVEWDETKILALPFYMSHTNGALAPFGNVKRLRLPSTLGSTYEITAREYANHPYLKEVEIPSCVTKINSSAFAGSEVEKVAILGSPVIASDAFSNIKLTDLTLQDATVAGTIFSESFYLEHLTLYGGTLADHAFQHCGNLETISATANVEVADGANPFFNCYNVNNLDAISYWATSAMDIFAKPIWITLIDIQNHDTYFRKNLLINGVEPKVLTFDMETVPANALYRIKNVRNLVLTDNVKAIGGDAISAPNLEHLTCYGDINQVRSVGGGALHSNPKKVTLHITPETEVPTTGVWSGFRVMRNAGPVTLNVCAANADDESPIQLYAVNTDAQLTWRASGLDCVSVDENGLATIHPIDQNYDGTTDRYGKVIATAANGDEGEFRVEYTPSIVTLTDGQPYANTKDVDVESVTYTRTFSTSSAGKWQAWYAPFDLDPAEYADQFSFARIYMVAYVNPDTKELVSDPSMGDFSLVFAYLHDGETVKAGTPYVIRAKQAGTYQFESAGVLHSCTENHTISSSTTSEVYSFTGHYDKTVSCPEGWYALAAGGGFIAAEGKTLNPYRWHFAITSTGYGSTTEPDVVANARMYVLGEEDKHTTSLTQMQMHSHESKFYDMQGRLYSGQAKHRGITIQNGKKYIR